MNNWIIAGLLLRSCRWSIRRSGRRFGGTLAGCGDSSNRRTGPWRWPTNLV